MPAMANQFAKLTPKEIGTHLEVWFQSLDTPDLESKKELKGCLIPKSGQHRAGGIPRFVNKFKNFKQPAQWQAVLGSHLSMNFWLKKEQQVAYYLCARPPVILEQSNTIHIRGNFKQVPHLMFVLRNVV